jgi:hypothetical protein
MFEMPRQNPLGLSIYTFFFKNEGQEGKQFFSGGGYLWEGGRHKRRVNEGEYGA